MCLVLATAWALVAVWEALFVFPWDQGGVYLRAVSVVDSVGEGVIVAVIGIWLLSASRVLRAS